MIRRYGSALLNSKTAYCFGGNETQDLHITRRSKQYFIHDKQNKKIIPISSEEAKKFAEDNNFELIKKRGLTLRVYITYKTYKKLLDICKGDESKIKTLIKNIVNEKLNSPL